MSGRALYRALYSSATTSLEPCASRLASWELHTCAEVVLWALSGPRGRKGLLALREVLPGATILTRLLPRATKLPPLLTKPAIAWPEILHHLQIANVPLATHQRM